MIANILDRVILAVSPARGAERIATRQMFDASIKRADQITARGLESAERNRLRSSRWLGSRLSTDAMLAEDLEDTRHRSRELYRNDFIGGAIDSRVEHVVGTGFSVLPKVRAKSGVITETQAKKINEQLEEVFEQVEPIACSGRKRSLWAKVSLIQRSIDADGEAFAVFSDVGHEDAPIPLVVEVIDPDRVETPPDKATDPLCRMGIQYDNNKAISGYWIRRSHPNDDKEFSSEYDFRPASRVCHIFVEWSAGQSRGLPWMTRALNRAKDGKDLTEAGIIGAQVEACFAGFVRTKTNPLTKAIGAASETPVNTKRLQNVQPGSLTYLNHDDEVTFATPQKSNQTGTLQEYNNRTIAAALNWPYEMVMKDWRGVSFAGGRIILHGAKLTTASRQKLITEMFLRCFWIRLVDEAVIVGAIDVDARVYRDNLHAFRRHVWTPPKWKYAITPGEETKDTVNKIDNNLMTLEEALQEDQKDWRDIVEQRQVEREAEREADVLPNETAKTETPAPETKTPEETETEAELVS